VNTDTRTSDLKHMLNERRREAQQELHSRVRGTRSDRPTDVREAVERAEASTQEDIELALAQVRADTVSRIDHALVRLDAGNYGSCLECSADISDRRLRALPFAVRCQACEEKREQQHGRARTLGQKRQSLSLFLDVLSP
jgi:DnaK suppressor protein